MLFLAKPPIRYNTRSMHAPDRAGDGGAATRLATRATSSGGEVAPLSAVEEILFELQRRERHARRVPLQQRPDDPGEQLSSVVNELQSQLEQIKRVHTLREAVQEMEQQASKTHTQWLRWRDINTQTVLHCNHAFQQTPDESTEPPKSPNVTIERCCTDWYRVNPVVSPTPRSV